MLSPKTIISFLVAASAVVALPGNAIEARGVDANAHGLAARQAIEVTVNTDGASVPFSFTPFPAEATTKRSLERRNAFGVVLGGVRDLIIALNAEDLEARERLTKEVAGRLAHENPGDAIVVCNVGFSFTGGEILEQATISYDAKIGASVTFEVVRFRVGTFTREGDGGFINWAWAFVNANCEGEGAVVSCS